MNRCRLAWTVLSLTLPTLISSTLAWADEAAAAPPTDSAQPANDRPAEKAASPASKAVVPSACLPVYAPVYIEDWGRLAALTQTDPVVYSKAEFWARRREQTNWVLGIGLIVGGGAVTLGIVDRLSTGEDSRAAKWIPAGLSVALVSLLANWAFAPDRDDLLTVINQWNLRHPDRLLAP